MISFSPYSLVFIVLFFVSCSSSKRLPSQIHLREKLISTFQKKNDCFIANDTSCLKNHIHPSVLFSHSNCWKEDYLSLMQDGNLKNLLYHKIDVLESKINIVENVGVIAGKAIYHITYKGNEMNLTLCYIETYLWTNQKWLLLTRQSTKIN